MKKICLFYIVLFLIFTLLLLTPYILAQDVNPPMLPEGTKAHFGEGRVKDIQFSPDSTRIAVGSDTGVCIYDARTGDELSKRPDVLLDELFESTDLISPDGKTFATVDDKGTIFLWEALTGNRRGTFRGHKGKVSALAFSPDGKRLASGTHGEIRLWDVALQRELLTFSKQTNKVLALVFLADGKTLASVDKDGTLRLWDADTGELRTSFTRLIENPKAVAFSPNGTILAAGNWAGNLQAWETATGREIFSRLTAHIGVVSTLAFTPNGETIASGGWDGTFRVWDVATRVLQLSNQVGRATANWELALSTDGYIFTGGSPWELVVSVDGSTFAGGIPADADATIQVWDAVTGNQKTSLVPKHIGGEWVLAISPDGTQLASGGRDGKIFIMETDTGEELVSLTGHTSGINTLVFSPDGTHLASSGRDGKIRLWDTGTGDTLLTLTDECGSLAFSTDGKILASAGTGVKLWHLKTGFLMVVLSEYDQLKALAFSPDGRALVGAGSGFEVWDVATGSLVADLTDYFYDQRLGKLLTIAFSPDGKTLASGGWDGIFLWEWNKIASWGIPVDEEDDLFSP